MPLLSLVGVRRWLGARQTLLAPKLTVVGPASQAGAAIHGALQQVPSLARSVLQPRRDRPFAKAREPVDGRGGAVDGLRLGGCPVGLDRVVAEVVCAALGHRVVPDEGREHQVHCDQEIDHIPQVHSVHGVGAFHWSGRMLAIRSAHGRACTYEIANRSPQHPARLRPDPPGRREVSGRPCGARRRRARLCWHRRDTKRNMLGHNENSDSIGTTAQSNSGVSVAFLVSKSGNDVVGYCGPWFDTQPHPPRPDFANRPSGRPRV
jgi:hypothetical protein